MTTPSPQARQARHLPGGGLDDGSGLDHGSGLDETGIVFDIQRYSLGDGPGIRTTVFFKGCPLRCAWCQNPESLRRAPELAFRSERCVDCRACADVCPNDAIRTGGVPRLDRSRCDGCGACVEACPTQAVTTIGRRYTVAELVETVAEDRAFYESSGGGVTLSGGEPTSQFTFVRAFLAACRAEGLHTAIETSGHVDRARLAELLPLLDVIQFDLKLADTTEHGRLTGVGNRKILENARWLAAVGAPVAFRIPLVPGVTDTETNLRETAAFLTGIGVHRVEICPYHTGWERKLRWLDGDTPRAAPRLRAATREGIHAAGVVLTDMGVHHVEVAGS